MLGPNRIRALIADDEPLARELLSAMLSAHDDVEVVGECGSGGELLEAVRRERPDLVFLDIDMPDLSGIEAARGLEPRTMPSIVFVTAHREHALTAFELDAVDYLLKPFDDARLAMALDRVRRQKSDPGDRLSRALRELRDQPRYRDRLLVRDGDRVTFVEIPQIDWLEARGKYTTAHVGTRSFAVKHGISEVEEKLDPERFVRVNRSSIVQIARVKEVQRWFKGEHLLVLENGVQLSTGRSYRERVEEVLGLR